MLKIRVVIQVEEDLKEWLDLKRLTGHSIAGYVRAVLRKDMNLERNLWKEEGGK